MAGVPDTVFPRDFLSRPDRHVTATIPSNRDKPINKLLCLFMSLDDYFNYRDYAGAILIEKPITVSETANGIIKLPFC